MPKLPRISATKAIKTLEKLGFIQSRQTGSHVIMKRRITSSEEIVCIVPLHRELKVGTLKGILRQAQVSTQEFIDVL